MSARTGPASEPVVPFSWATWAALATFFLSPLRGSARYPLQFHFGRGLVASCCTAVMMARDGGEYKSFFGASCHRVKPPL